jgi:hypothetical protein
LSLSPFLGFLPAHSPEQHLWSLPRHLAPTLRQPKALRADFFLPRLASALRRTITATPKAASPPRMPRRVLPSGSERVMASNWSALVRAAFLVKMLGVSPHDMRSGDQSQRQEMARRIA